MGEILDRLLQDSDPILQYKIRLVVLREDPSSDVMRTLAELTRNCEFISTLLSEQDSTCRIPLSPYKKWNGAHWVLHVLSDLCYPPGDERLRPLMEQDVEWIFSDQRMGWVIRRTKLAGGSPVRACATMESTTLLSMLRLGFMDARCDQLVKRLLSWQWSDGGWNCDMNPDAKISSFMESLLPLRALNLYIKVTGDSKAASAMERTTDIFLKRNLFRKLIDGSVMDTDFIKLHYPCYWHYDVLNGLKAMAECGFLSDPRCGEALDYLESRKLLDGGFPADSKYYHHKLETSGTSLVDWGPVSRKKLNPYVTTDALYVLSVAGR